MSSIDIAARWCKSKFLALLNPVHERGASILSGCALDHKLLAIASFIIHYFGWQARSRSGDQCPRWGRFAQADCRHEMRPMTFLDPGAFSDIDVPRQLVLLLGCPLLPANSLNHTRKGCRREGLFSFSWIFVLGGRSSASGSDLRGSMPGQSSMKYDSVYPIFRTAAQARNRLGRKLRRGYSAAMPSV